jgi:histidinol-phosphatase (PHP family)
MVTRSCPNVIGHLDKIKIQNKYYPYFDESENWYQQEVKHTLDVIRASSAIIEVNTRGLYQKKSLTTYPSPWILQLIFHQRIPITLSSDAHHPDDLVSLFPDTAKLLLAIGFKKIRILMDGKWQEQQIKA